MNKLKLSISLLVLATSINCFGQLNKTSLGQASNTDLAKAQLGDSEAMMLIREKLNSNETDDVIPELCYWTAKLCSNGTLQLESPRSFMTMLKQHFENDMMKTTYAFCKIVNLEGIIDKIYNKQRDNLLQNKITPEEFKNNVKESPIYKNIRVGVFMLKECALRNSYAAQELADYYLRDYSEYDWDEAIKYYSLSLINDPYNAEALSTLSHCYYHGYGVIQNFSKAMEYWKRLYSLGVFWDQNENRDLRFLLGKVYNEGLGIPKNQSISMQFFNEGAKDNDAECILALGNIAYAQKNYRESYQKYKQAKSVPNCLNKSDIYIALSRAYRFGQGVKQDTDSATFYWNKAREFSNDRTVQVDVLTLVGNYKAQEIKPEMIWVKGGKFIMGATPEQKPAAYKAEYPARKISVHDYYIGMYEVTQEEWMKIMGYNPSANKGNNFPVDNVSWIEVKEFIRRLNEITGEEYYLPTEAEWEYAARGGAMQTSYRYIGGDNLDEVAWYSDNSNNASHPVGTKKPNSLGIYDMAGNVWEWCEDYKNGYGINSLTSFDGSGSKVRRGGSYSYFEWGCRAAFRGSGHKGYKCENTGFRLCKKVK